MRKRIIYLIATMFLVSCGGNSDKTGVQNTVNSGPAYAVDSNNIEALNLQVRKAESSVWDKAEKIVFGSPTASLDEFRDFALRARQSGATHIAIQAEDLPPAYWELSPPGDPYPAWVITNPGLLKLNPPEVLKSYIPISYGARLMKILSDRCNILEALGLKASFHTFEPQMLPEAFFRDYPDMRGPQVDNPVRSRVHRFAPSMSHPGVLALYEEAVRSLLKQCPCIDILEFRTNDSGAGIEWSPALYAGPNGRSETRNMDMGARIGAFLSAIQGEEGGEVFIPDIHVYNTKEGNPGQLARQLKKGQVIDFKEGSEGHLFKSEVGSLLYYRKSFAPVPGIPTPISFLEQLEEAASDEAPRLFILMGDPQNRSLYFDLFDAFQQHPSSTAGERYTLLKSVAGKRVGKAGSESLVGAWYHLHEAETMGKLLDSGGSLFIVGCVHQRWLVRPLVPFPEQLGTEDKNYYRKFQFQARSEQHADDLLDLQGSRFVDGFNGFRLSNRILAQINRSVQKARNALKSIPETTTGTPPEILQLRLIVFQHLVRTVRHVMEYQVLLDRVATLPSDDQENWPYPYIRPSDYWSREQLMNTARAEIDNTVSLLDQLRSYPGIRLIDHANETHEEYHRLLGPQLEKQLEKKLSIMMDRWDDYKEIRTN